MENFITIMKALSDPQRVITLMALQDGELCVCQIVKLLGLAPSTVSTHMNILKRAGLVEARKDSKWVYYRLPDESLNSIAGRCLEFTQSILAKDKQVEDVMHKLTSLKTEMTENICTI